MSVPNEDIRVFHPQVKLEGPWVLLKKILGCLFDAVIGKEFNGIAY